MVRTARPRLVRVPCTYRGAPAALCLRCVRYAGGRYAYPVRTVRRPRDVRVSTAVLLRVLGSPRLHGRHGRWKKWPASEAADWPRLADAWGSPTHDLARREASGAPAGRGLSQLVFHVVPCVKAGVEGVAKVHADRGGARRGHACRRAHQHRVRCAAAREEQTDRVHRVVEVGGPRESSRNFSI